MFDGSARRNRLALGLDSDAGGDRGLPSPPGLRRDDRPRLFLIEVEAIAVVSE
jgi:hypothetical protein